MLELHHDRVRVRDSRTKYRDRNSKAELYKARVRGRVSKDRVTQS